MEEQATILPVRRYGLIAVLLIALGMVYFIQGHPKKAPTAAPLVPISDPAQSTPALLPEFADRIPIVPGNDALYHVDAVLAGDVPHFVIDGPTPNVKTTAKQSISVVGWAVDVRRLRPAAGVAAVFDGKAKIAGTYGGVRPDVVQAFNNQAYAQSAFSVVVPGRLLKAGKHSFQLLILSEDRSKYFQVPNTVTIEAGS